MARSFWGAAAVLAVLVAVVFARVADHEFLFWDDPTYVTRNPAVTGGLAWDGFVWAFTEVWAANWHPLTWLSHMLDIEVWGLWPGGHHLTNLLWHVLNTVLVALLFYRTTGALWRSVLVAALFGVHPLHVESVAWVSERKDVLSGFFWLLTLLLYVRYVRRPGTGRYLAVTAALIAGLMAKPMVVTLPVILLLFDFWPLCRVNVSAGIAASWQQIRPLLLEKLPWAALVVGAALITLYAQSQTVIPVAAMGWHERLAYAAIGYGTYLWQTIWPVGLSFFYRPHGNLAAPLIAAILSLGAVSGVVFWAWWRHGARAPLVGWLWYLISLLPVIGIIKVGAQIHADRYTYLPLIGIFFAVLWGGNAGPTLSNRSRGLLALLALVVVLAAAAGAWRQTGYWRNDELLNRRALEVDPYNHVAQLQLGEALHLKGDLAGAEAAARRALALSSERPLVFFARTLLGNIAFARGDLRLALNEYEQALAADRRSALAHYNLGTVLLLQGELRQAASLYQQAIVHDPNYSDAYANLGVAQNRLGDVANARRALTSAVALNPDNLGARYNLAQLDAQVGNHAAARAQLREILRRQPGHAKARHALSQLSGLGTE